MVFNKRLVLIRRLSQCLFFVLFLYSIWKTRYPLTCYINPKIFFQFDPLVMILTVIAERVVLIGLVYSLMLLVLTFIFGRVFCGWFCPLGTLMDLFEIITKFIYKKIHKIYIETEPLRLRFIKYGILSVLFVSAVFGIQLAWLFDPITIYMRTFSFIVHPAVNGAINSLFRFILEKTDYPIFLEGIYNAAHESFLTINTPRFPNTTIILIIFIVILLLTLVKRRLWCRYLCPLGAILALVARFSLLKRVVKSCYDNCHNCKHTCRMNAITYVNSYLSSECTVCLDCINDCPKQDTVFTFKRGLPGGKNNE